MLTPREIDEIAKRVGHEPHWFAHFAEYGIVHPFRRREDHVWFKRGRMADNVRTPQGRHAGSRIHRA